MPSKQDSGRKYAAMEKQAMPHLRWTWILYGLPGLDFYQYGRRVFGDDEEQMVEEMK